MALQLTSRCLQSVRTSFSHLRIFMVAGQQCDRQYSDNAGMRGDEDRTLFVKNISYDTTKDTVEDFFPECEEVRMPKRPDGSCKGFAFITFKTPEEVEELIKKKQGHKLNGRPLFLDYSGSKGGMIYAERTVSAGGRGRGAHIGVRGNTKILFVKNLNFRVDDDTLKKTFEDAVEAQVLTTEDGKSKGVGFVEFESKEAAAIAQVNMQRKPIKGRPVHIDFTTDIQRRRAMGENIGYGDVPFRIGRTPKTVKPDPEMSDLDSDSESGNEPDPDILAEEFREVREVYRTMPGAAEYADNWGLQGTWKGVKGGLKKSKIRQAKDRHIFESRRALKKYDGIPDFSDEEKKMTIEDVPVQDWQGNKNFPQDFGYSDEEPDYRGPIHGSAGRGRGGSHYDGRHFVDYNEDNDDLVSQYVRTGSREGLRGNRSSRGRRGGRHS